MSDWLPWAIAIFKGAHITALILWCGGLLALPLMLSRHDPAVTPDDYQRIRRATQTTYAVIVTPAAVIAVVAGTWLIFLREVFVPWFYAKLVFVAALAAAHAWIGHLVVQVAEKPGRDCPAPPVWPISATFVPVLAILFLVLGKPDLVGPIDLPEWLLSPRNGQLPFDVPR
ncbi:hypothetical protein EU805_16715 [Salipiger sp. IMCC34102]|uniref:CopD family protein n=1 Tax=Salipiger sp. IMCC34102 TaxID=2510647 RepID=UPI00101C5B44|nr:CopD family protein [Salipiger sp. IMCC34102]RYH00760.1 hypothetical protein EU805_16715 [Salipiger sp. IMCC34102]